MKKLAPSILSADFSILREELQKIEDAGARYVHIDVMDGHFVPNITLGAPVIKKLRVHSGLVFDVHLMITDPNRYMDDFIKAGADIITFHIETVDDPSSLIKKIKERGVKAGVSVNPETGLDDVYKVLDKVDMVLIMSVNPGFGGQSFIEETLLKVRALKKRREKEKLSFDIEIDGGISLNNAQTVLEAGVDVIVAGSAIFGAKDTINAVRQFINIFPKEA